MKEDRFCLYTAWKRLYENDKRRDKSKDKETALLSPKTPKDKLYEQESSRQTYECLTDNWNYGINCFFYLLADTTEEAIKYVKMAKYYLEKTLVILEGLEGEEARNWKSDYLRDLDCYEILIELLNNCLQNKELKNPLKAIINDYLKGDSQYAPLHFHEVVSVLNSMSEQ